MFTPNTTTVITAATGHKNLLRCLQSVQRQTHPSLEHMLVVDGPHHQAAVQALLAQLGSTLHPIHVITLPYATGQDNWCGHRIYGGVSFLSNSEFIAYLDEDNTYEPDHIASLVAAIRSTDSVWAFSLRNIVNEEGRLLCRDECESLGNLHPVYDRGKEHLVDTNCYLMLRQIAVTISSHWYGQARPPAGQEKPDARVCRLLLHFFPKVCSNLQHTVNYAVGSTPESIQAAYFLQGNQIMRQKYPSGLPWEQSR